MREFKAFPFVFLTIFTTMQYTIAEESPIQTSLLTPGMIKETFSSNNEMFLNSLSQKQILEKCLTLFKDAFIEFEEKNKVSFSTKGDGSLVSNLELKIEKIIGDFLYQETPWAGFQGEEGVAYDALDGSKGYRWYLDPIDGTISFRNGLSTFAFTLTLVHNTEAIATIIYFPRLKDTYIALKGKGAKKNGNTISMKQSSVQPHSVFAISDNYTFDMTNRSAVLTTLRALPYVTRSITDIFGYCMVAEGKCIGKFDAAGALWDLWPGHLLIQESGGKSLFFPVPSPTADLAGSMLVGREEIIAQVYKFISEKTEASILPLPLSSPQLHT